MSAPHFTVIRWKDLERWIVPRVVFQTKDLPAGWTLARLGDDSLVCQVQDRVRVEADEEYRMVGVRWYGEGAFHRETNKGKDLSATYVTPVVPGAFIYNRLFAWKESFAVVPPELGGCFVSSEFPQFIIDESRLLTRYLCLYFRCRSTLAAVDASSVGSAAVSRNRFKEGEFLDFRIPLPPLPIQRAIVERWQTARSEIAESRGRLTFNERAIPNQILAALGTPPIQAGLALPKGFALNWKEIERWSVGYIRHAKSGALGFTQSIYPIVPLSDCLVSTNNGYCIRPVPHQTLYQMLKLNALTESGLDVTKSKHVEVNDRTAARFSLQEGDLLICRSVGSFDQIAKCALTERDYPTLLFPDIIIRVRLKDSVLPEYVREVIQTPLGRAFFQSNARTAVGMWKIGAADIRNFPIPLPPLAVQQEIVNQVQEQRKAIGIERLWMGEKAAAIKEEIEQMILGARPAPAHP